METSTAFARPSHVCQTFQERTTVFPEVDGIPRASFFVNIFCRYYSDLGWYLGLQLGSRQRRLPRLVVSRAAYPWMPQNLRSAADDDAQYLVVFVRDFGILWLSLLCADMDITFIGFIFCHPLLCAQRLFDFPQNILF